MTASPPMPSERTYRIQRASEFSGVSVELIRAWERRYGVLNPTRTPSGYRVYTDADIAVLKRLKQLTEQGMSIAEASRLVKDTRAQASPPELVSSTRAEHWKQELIRAGSELDQAAVHRVIDEAFASVSPVRVFDELIAPVMEHVGNAWHRGELSVAQEHLVTQAVRARLLTVLHTSGGADRRHALLACFPDEQHELGLLGAALRFRQAGFRVTYLGQRTPASEIGRAAKRIAPEVIALSSVQDDGEESFRERLEEIVRELPKKARVVVGGRGALAHEDVCRELHVELVVRPQDWATVLE